MDVLDDDADAKMILTALPLLRTERDHQGVPV